MEDGEEWQSWSFLKRPLERHLPTGEGKRVDVPLSKGPKGGGHGLHNEGLPGGVETQRKRNARGN